MPVIKSAKKQMRQNVKHRERNYPVRNQLKTLFKKELKYIEEGRMEEAVKFLPTVYSLIDTARKKNLIHPNNADRKKSRLARALNGLQARGDVAAVAGVDIGADIGAGVAAVAGAKTGAKKAGGGKAAGLKKGK